jgi:glycosyltransferase involved in cell wall biosynthesis
MQKGETVNYSIKMFMVVISFITSTSLFSIGSLPEKPIVVVVCSYNNHQWTKNTLDSIFTQNYSNFRLIIVDDCSSDGNQRVIQKYIDDHGLADRVTFIQNSVRRRKLFNLYHVLYKCDDDEIVVMVDGDDSLAHPDVFAQLNATYEDEKVWFTYGQYKNVPASQAILWGHKEMGYCRPVPAHIIRKQAYRYYSFVYMHLRSFRGWLFKLVKLEDLIAEKIPGFEGDFYPASNDVAMYFPMVEMAHNHVKFIPDILYIRNLYSDIVGFKVDRKIQTASAREIRKKECYPVLFKPKKNRLAQFKDAKADMFIVCKYGINDIGELIENVQEKVSSLGIIHIFFSDTIENKALCRRIKHRYPEVIFMPYSSTGSKILKNRLLDSLGCSTVDHFVITTDSFTIFRPINLSEVILSLEKTYAYRFYLNRNLTQISSRFVNVDDDICAWKFSSSIRGWRGVNSVNDMVLCRKSDFIRDFKIFNFDTVYSFVNVMHQVDASVKRLGLFFKDAKVRSID